MSENRKRSIQVRKPKAEYSNQNGHRVLKSEKVRIELT